MAWKRGVSALLSSALSLVAASAAAAEWHVSATGTAGGDGSAASPWDLATVAFGGAGVVAPGDTVWMHAGTYGDGGNQPIDFVMYGEANSPIIVRAFPGERATINGGVTVQGAHTWLWGLEITNLGTERDVTSVAGDASARLGGVSLIGLGSRAINLVVHNTGHPAISFYDGPGDGAEVYGCIIWGNGIYDPTTSGSPRGNGLYAHDEADHSRTIANNISFRNWTEGLDAHSAGSAHVNGFTFEGNIAFDNPTANLSTNTKDPASPSRGLRIVDNCTYYRRTDNPKMSAIFGYYNDVFNEDITLTGNYFVNGSADDRSVHVKLWRTGTVTNNTFVTERYFAWWWNGLPGESYTWNDNTYFLGGGTGQPFAIGPSNDITNGSDFNDFAAWKTKTGFDAQSTLTMGYPSGLHVCKRPNKYEPDRAHLAVYNWDALSTAQLDLSDLVQVGKGYELLDAQNLFASPIASGTYAGGTVSVPMNLTDVAEIRGTYRHWTHRHTAPEFAAFVLFSDVPLVGPGGGGASGAGAGGTGGSGGAGASGDGGTGGADQGGEGGNGDAGDGSGGAVAGSGGASKGGGESSDGDGGCGCRTAPTSAPLSLVLLVLLGATCRARRLGTSTSMGPARAGSRPLARR